MIKEYVFKSMHCGKCIVKINNDKITIERKGFMALIRYGLKGEKSISISHISAVQLKRAGITVGYIQFVIMGSQESKGGLQSAMNDENTVVFGGGFHDKELNENALEIKQYIENNNFFDKTKNTFVKVDDKYDQLNKLKKLLDNGIVSQVEYENEKTKILNS